VGVGWPELRRKRFGFTGAFIGVGGLQTSEEVERSYLRVLNQIDKRSTSVLINLKYLCLWFVRDLLRKLGILRMQS
jgi:hypothetical protein